jgi:hypothetical protein
MNANTTEATDNTDDGPQPIAEVAFSERVVQLYDDGATVELLFDGSASCSEHGALDRAHDMNVAQCDHQHDTDGMDLPTFDSEDFLVAAATDRTIQDEAFERISKRDPERIINEYQRYEV